MNNTQRNLGQALDYAVNDLVRNYPNDMRYYLEVRMYGNGKAFRAIIRNEDNDEHYGSNSVSTAPFRIEDTTPYTTTNYYHRPSRSHNLIGINYVLDELKKPIVVKDNTNTKDTFNNHLRGIIEYILLQPAEDRKILEREIIDNINELHYNNNY